MCETPSEANHEITEQLKGVETTLRLLTGSTVPALVPDGEESLAQRIRGKTQPEALAIIASTNSGTFKVKEAKQLMLQAGLISNPKNANSIMHTLVGRMKASKTLEKIGRGEYRLVKRRSNSTVYADSSLSTRSLHRWHSQMALSMPLRFS